MILALKPLEVIQVQLKKTDYMDKIISIFGSYADMYAEYWNNFLTPSYFCEYYGIAMNDFMLVYEAKRSMPEDKPLSELDHYVGLKMANK